MRSRRIVSLVAGALVALAIAVPASAQGKSGGNKGGGKKTGKSPGPSPSTSALPPRTGGSAGGAIEAPLSAAAPFAWMDDASLMAPGGIWVGISMMRWHGSGLSETIVPVVDGAIGLTPRLQLGASVPRVGGGLGTTFIGAKVGVYSDESRGVRVAVAPTLEVVGGAAMEGATGQSRAQWGLPISIQVDRDQVRFYGSSGYFSPGIWYAGAGLGRSVAERVGVSASLSHAWTSSASSSAGTTPAGPRRSEVSGGASYDLTPSVSVFGSLGRTLGMAAEDGAGTTLSIGLSLSGAAPHLMR